MPYIGKPQSADPITVNASNIEDGSILAADISSSLGDAISGSFTTVSSSFSTRVSDVEAGSTSKTLVSSSAQIADDISGSLGSNASVIRSLDRTTISGSITTVSSSLASRVTVNEGRVNQGVKTTDSPTFAAATITGTLTAQEVHTEFESASILFTSGSTQFGNSSDDVHDFLGNTISGSATSTGSFGSIVVPGNVDFNANLDVDGTTNLDVVDIDGAVTQDGGNIVFNEDSANQDFRVESNGQTHMLFVDGDDKIGIAESSPSTTLHITRPGSSYTAANLAEATTGAAFLRIVPDGTDANSLFASSVSGYRVALQVSGSANNDLLLQPFSGNVGIGTNNPVSKIDVRGASSTIALNTSATAVFTLDPPDVSNGTYLFGDGSGGGDQVQILAVNDSAANQNEYAGIGFAMKTSGNTVTTLAGIAGIKENDTDGSGGDVGALAFGCRTTGDYVKERMRITSDGELLLKCTSLANDFGAERGQLCISSTNHASNNNYAVLQLQGHSNSNSVGTGGIYFYDHSNNVALIQSNRASSESTSNLLFYTNGGSLTEKMRITSDGRIGINQNSPNAKLHIHETTNGQELIFLNHSVTGANQTFIQFRHDGTQRGNIQVNDSNDQIVYNTSVSDKRLKKDFEDWDESILPAFKSLKPQLFNFINSENKSGKTKGYIAQDNVEDFPEAYTTSKVLDDDTEYYSFNPSGMVTYLMKAVQELSAKVEELEK